jgi:hypothetical protein
LTTRGFILLCGAVALATGCAQLLDLDAVADGGDAAGGAGPGPSTAVSGVGAGASVSSSGLGGAAQGVTASGTGGGGMAGGGQGGAGAGPWVAAPSCNGNGKISDLVDSFDVDISTTLWSTSNAATTVAWDAGTVLFTFGSTQGYAGVYSQLAYDLADCAVSVEVLDSPNAAFTPSQFIMSLDSDSGSDDSRIVMLTEGGDLYCYYDISNGSMGDESPPVAYDPVQDRIWRIGEQAGTVQFETSPNGVSWKTIWENPTPAWVSSGVTVNFGAGNYAVVSGTPGGARFDHVNMLPQ